MSEDPVMSLRRARFEALALPHLDSAYNLARWLSRDEHDASDIVQDAFLRAYAAFDGLRGDNARPWLLAIVRNTCFTWMARNRSDGQVGYDEEQHACADPAGDPEQHALQAESKRRVDRALAQLPAEFREVLVLRELEQLSYKEIAQVLAIPIGTVMSRLARGRQQLARQLDEGSAHGGR